MPVADEAVNQRLKSLESHLQRENPALLEVVASFRELDRMAYRLGLLERDESYATRIPWWPLISVLGTFSSGKSTFINHYLGMRLQSTGNQAVDDRFTVLCHSREENVNVLPGLALDADPRFPFYQISDEIEKVAGGEGARIDSYLQLKTCPAEALKGKILIDSPGFDADAQRTATLRLTEHIIDLSDLVLVFFDARHPEPGAMQDTLEHLVARSLSRPDASKFLYVLNQIDTTAREDNPEEVFGAWQRALAQKGLTAGRFYTIYNPEASVPIEDANLRQRFENKRDADLCAIHERIAQVEVERSYRIVGSLEKQAKRIENRLIPLLRQALQRWKKQTLIAEGVIFAALAITVLTLLFRYSPGEGWLPTWPSLLNPGNHPIVGSIGLMVIAVLLLGLHFRLRNWRARGVLRWLEGQAQDENEAKQLRGGFMRSTRYWRSLFSREPAGWWRGTRRTLHKLVGDTDRYVQRLNDRFANPSGKASASPADASSETSEASAQVDNK